MPPLLGEIQGISHFIRLLYETLGYTQVPNASCIMNYIWFQAQFFFMRSSPDYRF